MRLVLVALALLLTVTSAAAQLLPGNSSPNFVFGEIPSAAQWNQGFSTKFDFAGGLLGGPLGLPASTPAGAPFNIDPGVTPRSPLSGDIWMTGAGLFLQIGGATVGPLASQLGVTNGSNAAAGDVGEVISSDIPIASAISATSGLQNVTSVALSPGDFDCSATIVTAPASNAVTNEFTAGISTASATLPPLENATAGGNNFGSAAGDAQALPVATVRENVTATTTVFLVTNLTFSTSTMKVYGRLECRRMR
jgi:hypothetical protein